MSKKKRTDPTRKEPSLVETPAMSELAAVIIGCRSRSNLPMLADYLEEKHHLSSTAQLLRLPELVDVPKHCDDTVQEFDYYPLGVDTFLWITVTSYWVGSKVDLRPGTLIGLYAHPAARLSKWVKITALLPVK